jgi:arginase
MKIDILQVPYDSGHRGRRMGSGPEHFIKNGLEAYLEKRGHKVKVRTVESQELFPLEVVTAFDLYRQLAIEVRKTVEAGRMPLVLSCNCGAASGTLAGLPEERLGVLWFDAHGDFNTPETTPSGYLDGMGLATASGLCWKKLSHSIPNFRPVPARQIVHAGGRSFDLEEEQLLIESGVQVVTAAEIQAEGVSAALDPAFENLSDLARTVYLHLDLDVLDPTLAPANHFPAPGGLSVETVVEMIELARSRFTIAALGVASYDPANDLNNRTIKAGMKLMEAALKK